jgi:hypothetical protein
MHNLKDTSTVDPLRLAGTLVHRSPAARRGPLEVPDEADAGAATVTERGEVHELHAHVNAEPGDFLASMAWTLEQAAVALEADAPGLASEKHSRRALELAEECRRAAYAVADVVAASRKR